MGLALGIDDPYGNYSAAEHALGPMILAKRPYATIFDLARKLAAEGSPATVRRDIYDANIPFLKVSVGTEMAMLLQPDKHWVANTRSIWSHLFMKHASVAKANEELRLYRDGSESSEMAYKIWCAVHAEMKQDFINLAAAGAEAARRKKLEPGTVVYLWADAVANALYEQHGG